MVSIQTIEDLKNIIKNDIELIFDDIFNQKIIIPNSVQTLIFGEYFNQKINILKLKLLKIEIIIYTHIYYNIPST